MHIIILGKIAGKVGEMEKAEEMALTAESLMVQENGLTQRVLWAGFITFLEDYTSNPVSMSSTRHLHTLKRQEKLYAELEKENPAYVSLCKKATK